MLTLLSVINLLGLIYLTYIVYNKNRSKNKDSSSPNGSLNQKIKIHLTRFNPFSDVGSDQSFILCLLDEAGNGALITSLHSRDTTRVYAKSIFSGQNSDVVLSNEEKSAILETINHS